MSADTIRRGWRSARFRTALAGLLGGLAVSGFGLTAAFAEPPPTPAIVAAMQAVHAAQAAANSGPRVYAPVDRSGTFRVIGKVNKVSKLFRPLSVFVVMFHSSQSAIFEEEAGTTVKFNGKTGSFGVKIPFVWKGADQNSGIQYAVAIYAGNCQGVGLPVEGPCERVSYKIFTDPLPLPTDQDVTTTISVSMTE